MSQEYKDRLRREKEAAVAAEAERAKAKKSRVKVSNGISQQAPAPTPAVDTSPAKAAEEKITPLNLEDGKIRIYITLNDDRGVERVDWDPRLTAYSALLATIEAQTVMVPSLNKFLNDAIEAKVQEARQEAVTNE